MTRIHSAIWLFSLVMTSVLGGCVRAYHPPRADEPHAILKLRRTYEKTAGVQLGEILMLGEYLAYSNSTRSDSAAVPLNDAILIHPVPAELDMKTRFTHQVTRRVQERYHVREPYQAQETYDCGTGKNHRTCTRSVTRYRDEQKTRWVDKTETVTDGACSRSLGLAPKQGASYLLQYTYQDNGICSFSCFEQVPGSDGSLSQVPCA